MHVQLTLTTLCFAPANYYVVTTLTHHEPQASMVVVSALFMLPTAVIFPRMFARANIPPQSFTLARVRARNRLRAARKQQQQYSTYNRAAPAAVARTARVQQATATYYGADVSDDVYKRGSDMSSQRISPVAAMTPSPTTNGRKQSVVAWGASSQDTTAVEVRHAEHAGAGRNNVLKKGVHGWTDAPEASINIQECNIWKDLVRLQLVVIKLTSALILTGSLVTGKAAQPCI
jgi:hypothetical protein